MKNLQIEKKGPITIIKINRPEKLNALNRTILQNLYETIRKIDCKETKVLIITGVGKSFVAGADIAEMKDFGPLEARSFSVLGQTTFNLIESLKIPVIAAVNGYALGGGCELAIACDIIIASTKAKFGQPEINLGIIPGFGGTQRLPRLIGKSKAKELIFLGDIISAEEALRIGLVTKVVPPEKLDEYVIKLAEKLAKKSSLALSLIKQAVNYSDYPLSQGLKYELEIFSLCFAHQDQKEGMSAFLEKREPKFS